MKELPHLAEYIASLPQGLDSYPQARAKASLYRSTIATWPSPASEVSGLPAPLRRLAEYPRPVSSWIPEAHSAALVLATRDLACTDDADFLDFCYQQQRTLFSGRLYAVLLKMTSPSTLLRTAAFRWRSLHRGSSLIVDHASTTGASVHVEQQPHVWNRLLGLAFVEGLRAVLDLCGVQDLTLVLDDVKPEALHVSGTWRPPL